MQCNRLTIQALPEEKIQLLFPSHRTIRYAEYGISVFLRNNTQITPRDKKVYQALGLYVAVGLTAQTGTVPEGIVLVGEGFSSVTYSTFTTVGITPPVCSLKLLCPITSRMLRFGSKSAMPPQPHKPTSRDTNSPSNGSTVGGDTDEGV